ncbi:predicted protein [Postia placenta Mad-698-R]|nr:predicted protein [Postia placenta Mad-698-R]
MSVELTVLWGKVIQAPATNIYYLCFPRDSALQKSAVYAICAYEWVQSVLIAASFSESIVAAISDPIRLFHSIGDGWFSIFFMSAVMSAVVQLFYAWRLLKLTGSRCLTSLIILLWLGGSALADIIIAISMIIAVLNELIAGVAIIALGLFAVPNLVNYLKVAASNDKAPGHQTITALSVTAPTGSCSAVQYHCFSRYERGYMGICARYPILDALSNPNTTLIEGRRELCEGVAHR